MSHALPKPHRTLIVKINLNTSWKGIGVLNLKLIVRKVTIILKAHGLNENAHASATHLIKSCIFVYQ